MMNGYSYNTCCVNADGESITDMIDKTREITARTFFKHISLKEVSTLLGYDRHFPIKNDYHVSYYKSVFKNEPCYYLTHSAIEYIWTKNNF